MSIRVTGISNVLNNLNRVRNAITQNINREVSNVAHDLLSKSIQRAPIDTGDLRGSGTVEVNGSSAIVAYSTQYALRQHEELNYHHDNGEAKYLENPLKENERTYIQYLIDAIRRVTR